MFSQRVHFKNLFEKVGRRSQQGVLSVFQFDLEKMGAIVCNTRVNYNAYEQPAQVFSESLQDVLQAWSCITNSVLQVILLDHTVVVHFN